MDLLIIQNIASHVYLFHLIICCFYITIIIIIKIYDHIATIIILRKIDLLNLLTLIPLQKLLQLLLTLFQPFPNQHRSFKSRHLFSILPFIFSEPVVSAGPDISDLNIIRFISLADHSNLLRTNLISTINIILLLLLVLRS